MPFEITKRVKYSLVTITSEKMDGALAPSLKAEFIMLNAQGVKNIILDLNNCIYCDASGLSTLTVANRLCNDAIGALVLTGVSPKVRDFIKQSTQHNPLLIAGSVEEAEELFKKKESMLLLGNQNDL